MARAKTLQKTSSKKRTVVRPAVRRDTFTPSKRTKLAVAGLAVLLLAIGGFIGYTLSQNYGASAAGKQLVCLNIDSKSTHSRYSAILMRIPPRSATQAVPRGHCYPAPKGKYTISIPAFYGGFRQSYDGKPYGDCHKAPRTGRDAIWPNQKPRRIEYLGYKYYKKLPGKKAVCQNIKG